MQVEDEDLGLSHLAVGSDTEDVPDDWTKDAVDATEGPPSAMPPLPAEHEPEADTPRRGADVTLVRPSDRG